MLVLTRKIDEVIFIGEDIRVMVVSISRTQVRLGLSCPAHLRVSRGGMGTRLKKAQWPNLTPNEIWFLICRWGELDEWYYMENAKERKREREDLTAFIEQMKEQALLDSLEAYSEWYRGE